MDCPTSAGITALTIAASLQHKVWILPTECGSFFYVLCLHFLRHRQLEPYVGQSLFLSVLYLLQKLPLHNKRRKCRSSLKRNERHLYVTVSDNLLRHSLWRRCFELRYTRRYRWRNPTPLLYHHYEAGSLPHCPRQPH